MIHEWPVETTPEEDKQIAKIPDVTEKETLAKLPMVNPRKKADKREKCG